MEPDSKWASLTQSRVALQMLAGPPQHLARARNHFAVLESQKEFCHAGLGSSSPELERLREIITRHLTRLAEMDGSLMVHI